MERHLIKGSVLSYTHSTQTDCFGNKGEATWDHIYPVGHGGSDMEQNKQLLTEASNMIKGEATKGTINNYDFAIERFEGDETFNIGQMFIRVVGDTEWLQVLPSHPIKGTDVKTAAPRTVAKTTIAKPAAKAAPAKKAVAKKPAKPAAKKK